MSIVLLVGGGSAQGNAEHRYLVDAFLEHFGDQVRRIITCEPTTRPLSTRLKRAIRRGHYRERLARWRHGGLYGPDPELLQQLLRPDESQPLMPGGDRVAQVSSHNGSDCAALLDAEQPAVIAVYGTAIIRPHIFERARNITLNMHTGLSPWYRGDSTLFWPVHDNEPERLGVTVHELVESVDGGAIAATATIDYEPGDGEAELFAKGVRAGTRLYLDCVSAALDGTLHCEPQDLHLGREFRWMDRTVAAEKRVTAQLARWQQAAS